MHGSKARAAIVTAALLVIGALTAQPASASPADTEVRGVVTVNGRALAGIRVGTWSPRHGRIATTVTDAHGAFILRSRADIAVDVWAGADPGAAKAVFSAGNRHLVRGVIGSSAPRDLPSALWQEVTAAPPARLGDHKPLRFRLQEAGRFTAAPPVGGTGGIALIRGGEATTVAAARGTGVDSGWLVPGSYDVRWEAQAGRLPLRTRVRVAPGVTSVRPPVLPEGTTVSLRVTCHGEPVGTGVPVIRRTATGDVAAGTTNASGIAVLRNVAPGSRSWIVGRTATGSDATAPTQPTDDRYLPSGPITLTVHPGQRTATAAVALRPAARISGHVAQRPGHPVLVVAEDASGDPVRSTTASHGVFTLGGLDAGDYRVVAEDQDAARFASAEVRVAAGSQSTVQAVLETGTDDPVVSGRLAGPGGLTLRAAAGARLFRRDVVVARSGRYSFQIPPGRFVPIAFVSRRVQAVSHAVSIGATTTLHLSSGERVSAVQGTVRVHGNGVALAPRLRGPRTVNEQFTQGPASSDIYSTEVAGDGFTGSQLPAGTYRIVGVDGPLPAVDGPWTFQPAPRTVRLRSGRTSDVGTVTTAVVG